MPEKFKFPSLDVIPEWMIPSDPKHVMAIAIFSFIGLIVTSLLSRGLKRILEKRTDEHRAQIGSRMLFFLFSSVILLSALNELNVSLTPLLGAAGVASIAIGFAAQSGLSNLISGLFIYAEKPFRVGDLIRVSGTLGVVMSIDLTSVKLRTLDHLFVRIPNSNVIGETVQNITRFPIRRMDIAVGVNYNSDPEKVMKILREVAETNCNCLDNPAPLVLFDGFGDSALEFKWGLWFEKNKFVDLRNSALTQLKKRFDEEGIEIPFPHRTLTASADSPPLAIRIVQPDFVPTGATEAQPTPIPANT